jgi:hypothetical protein
MLPFRAARIGALVLLVTALAACHKSDQSAQATGTSAPATGTSMTVYTGPATLVRSERPYSGRLVDAVTFVDCSNATIHVQPTDSVTPGGSCSTPYDLAIRSSARSAVVKQFGSGSVLINGISTEGDNAVATYVRGDSVGQVLLERTDGSWTPKSVVSGILSATSGAAGVSEATVQRLQRKLPFDVSATPLPLSR